MSKRVFNWNFNDVADVLKTNGFTLNHTKGSHYFYIGSVSGVMHQVCVPKHGKKSFKPRTFKGIVTQSGLPKKAWGL